MVGFGGKIFGHREKGEKAVAETNKIRSEDSFEKELKAAKRSIAPYFLGSVAVMAISAEEFFRTNNGALLYPLLGGTLGTLGSYGYIWYRQLRAKLARSIDNEINRRQ